MDYIVEFYKGGVLKSKCLSNVNKIYNNSEVLIFMNKKKEIIFVVNIKCLSNAYKF